jgi:hypothetical protein
MDKVKIPWVSVRLDKTMPDKRVFVKGRFDNMPELFNLFGFQVVYYISECLILMRFRPSFFNKFS